MEAFHGTTVLSARKGGQVALGSGEVMKPDDGILAAGPNRAFALATARSLVQHSDLAGEDIVRESLTTAAGICVYTNNNITVESLSLPVQMPGRPDS